MSQPGDHEDTESALVIATFGPELLSYLCATDEPTISRRLRGEIQLGQQQEDVLVLVRAMARQAQDPAGARGLPSALRLGVLGTHDPQLGTSLGNGLRSIAGGHIDSLTSADAVLEPVLKILRDVYPLTLVPTGHFMDRTMVLGGPVYNHPTVSMHCEPCSATVPTSLSSRRPNGAQRS